MLQETTDLKSEMLQKQKQPAKPLKPQSTTTYEGSLVRAVTQHLCENTKVEDPFYMADLDQLDRLYNDWHSELPLIRPFYAVKCNPSVDLVRRLVQLGCGFDCASMNELKLILELGGAPGDIIFANPCKPPFHITFARAHSIAKMTFDSEEELAKIQKLYPEAELVLRIATDDSGSIRPISDKFGAPMYTVPRLLSVARDLALNVIGVAFHVGSGCQNPQSFSTAIVEAHSVFDMARDLGFRMSFLDIGGGFSTAGLGVADRTSFPELAQAIRTSLAETFRDYPHPLTVISEPGRYFAGPVFSLATRVYSTRVYPPLPPSTKGAPAASRPLPAYFINDGIFGSFYATEVNLTRPGLSILRPTDTAYTLVADEQTQPSMVWGPTCAPIDVVANGILLPPLRQDDWVVFPNMGAYTIAIATTFNGFPIPKIHYLK